MPVVTISRQFAAARAAVWEAVAERFGAELLDREIVAAVAERAGIPEDEAEGYDERLPGLWQRIAGALAAGAADPALPPVPTGLVPAAAVGDQLARITRAVVEEAAARCNAVIVGRGGACILGRRPGTLHVQLHAPVDHRVRLLAARVEEIPPDTRPDPASLRELVRQMDQRRSGYIRRLYGADQLDPALYDLSIDTSRIDDVTLVDLIVLAAERTATAAPADAG